MICLELMSPPLTELAPRISRWVQFCHDDSQNNRYMSICTYVVHIYIYIHIYVCVYIYYHIYIYTITYTCIYIYTYVYISIYCTYIYIYIYVCVYIYYNIYCIYTITYTYIHIYTYVYIYIYCTHTYIYIYILYSPIFISNIKQVKYDSSCRRCYDKARPAFQRSPAAPASLAPWPRRLGRRRPPGGPCTRRSTMK